jgi:hypothetical protein
LAGIDLVTGVTKLILGYYSEHISRGTKTWLPDPFEFTFTPITALGLISWRAFFFRNSLFRPADHSRHLQAAAQGLPHGRRGLFEPRSVVHTLTYKLDRAARYDLTPVVGFHHLFFASFPGALRVVHGAPPMHDRRSNRLRRTPASALAKTAFEFPLAVICGNSNDIVVKSLIWIVRRHGDNLTRIQTLSLSGSQLAGNTLSPLSCKELPSAASHS